MRLRDATVDTSGGKATVLGRMLRAGLPIPDGFVVPFDARGESARSGPDAVRDPFSAALAELGDPPVAVRSSAAGEDGAEKSAAGQYDSILGMQGLSSVWEAVERCWRSADSAHARAYRNRTGDDTGDVPEIAVLVQRMVDADVSGVMFTPERVGSPTRIDASWGLGLSVVGGGVTPDSFDVALDGDVRHRPAHKLSRVDRAASGSGVVTRDVLGSARTAPALDAATARRLAGLGAEVAHLLGAPQDIEWAIADDTLWLLQARPITVTPPPAPEAPASDDANLLQGTPGSRGLVTARARVMRGPSDFSSLRPGDVAICSFTDPSWTPLFSIVGGVVTETGGALSHAAIVAREYGIPAALAVPNATRLIPDGIFVTLDGGAGTIRIL